MSGLLTRDAILAAADLPHVDVPVPEWGGTVRIRTMTGAEREEYERSVASTTDEKFMKERLIALCAVDADGNRLFSTNGDLPLLSGKNYRARDRLAWAALRQNALTKAGLEDLQKNWQADRSGDTTSGSPNDSA